jgi:hypothetical protein
VGRAYATLDSDLSAAEAVVRRVAAASGNASFAAALTGAFLARAHTFADRIIADITGRSSDMLRNNNKEAAAELLQSVSQIVPYASQQAGAEWQRTLRRSSSSKLFSRTRGSVQQGVPRD